MITKTKLIKIKITGISPLLQNSPKAMFEEKTEMSSKKKVYDPVEIATKALYIGIKGNVIIPSLWFRSCMLEASSFIKIGKMSAKSVIGGSVFNVDAECDLINTKTKKPYKTYDEIDSRRAVVNKTAGILAHRPKFNNWECVLNFEVDLELFASEQSAEETIVSLLNRGGKIKGVGSYRPGCEGEFGRFKAEVLN